MVSGLGLERSILPNVHESSSITGRIHASAAAATGLAPGTPVIAGAGDQAASAVGNGIDAELFAPHDRRDELPDRLIIIRDQDSCLV